jgi:uncharacterized phage-like protein YoqJ
MEIFDFKKACFFTGHRIMSAAEAVELDALVEQICLKLYKQNHVTHFICGGAIGFDTLAARVVLRLRKRYPSVKLHLYLPCTDQAKKWSLHDKEVWQEIYNAADERYFVLNDKYIPGCMQQRNRAMVDAAYFAVAFCKNKRSGTYSTVKLAHEHGRFIYILPSRTLLRTEKL